jgi:3,4-dihydroxy-2-butanone 4-phosphate synthase
VPGGCDPATEAARDSWQSARQVASRTLAAAVGRRADRTGRGRKVRRPSGGRRRGPTVAAICEVMGPDGQMLTGSAVERFALAWSLPLISIGQLAAHL